MFEAAGVLGVLAGNSSCAVPEEIADVDEPLNDNDPLAPSPRPTMFIHPSPRSPWSPRCIVKDGIAEKYGSEKVFVAMLSALGLREYHLLLWIINITDTSYLCHR